MWWCNRSSLKPLPPDSKPLNHHSLPSSWDYRFKPAHPAFNEHWIRTLRWVALCQALRKEKEGSWLLSLKCPTVAWMGCDIPCLCSVSASDRGDSEQSADHKRLCYKCLGGGLTSPPPLPKSILWSWTHGFKWSCQLSLPKYRDDKREPPHPAIKDYLTKGLLWSIYLSCFSLGHSSPHHSPLQWV